MVALLAEGVDRNNIRQNESEGILGSPSSRRAWIEIRLLLPLCAGALSPSSRRAWIEINYDGELTIKLLGSPSSRRAWIEIAWVME